MNVDELRQYAENLNKLLRYSMTETIVNDGKGGFFKLPYVMRSCDRQKIVHELELIDKKIESHQGETIIE